MLEKEVSKDANDMVRAMFAQSSAITALAAQIANMSGDTIWSHRDVKQGSIWQDEVTAGSGGSQGLFLRGSHDEHVSENESSKQFQPDSDADKCTGSHYDPLCREVWRVWSRERLCGQIMWQVAMIMDYLQTGNWQGGVGHYIPTSIRCGRRIKNKPVGRHTYTEGQGEGTWKKNQEEQEDQ